MGEIKEVGTNGNGKVEVPMETLDIIAGLGQMSDLEGVHFPRLRIEALLQVIDEEMIIATEKIEFLHLENSFTRVINTVIWIRKIIEEIEIILSAQDAMIRKLKEVVNIPTNNETFKPNRHSLAALRSLTNLFFTDNLSYSEATKTSDLKAWAISNGYEYEFVKGLLASLPAEGKREFSLLGT